MAFYDKDRLLDEANAQMVAEYLGMDMLYKGNTIQIKCPGHLKRMHHEDQNFGNCSLTEKGYHCFACHKTVGLIQMVMEYEQIDDYAEALGIIGDSLGGRENYLISGDVQIREATSKVLSNEDLELLGLKANVSIDYIESVSNNKKMLVSEELIPKIPNTGLTFDAQTYLGTTHKTYSIRLLKNEDPEVYYTLIKNKAKEAMDKYEFLLETVCKKANKEFNFLSPIFGKSEEKNEELLYDLKNMYMDMYNRAKEIYMDIDENDCGNVEVQQPEEITIPHYDLFD